MTLARGGLLALAAAAMWAQDPYDLARRSIAQDQLDWARMKDYTWQARSIEKRLDARGKVESTKREAWETLIVEGEPYRRTLERDGKPLSPEEQRSENKKLDRETRRLASELPGERQARTADAEKRRRREFAFLSEIPELFDLRFEGEGVVDGRPVWVISGAPRPGAKAKGRDAGMLLKLHGRMWIDKATYQWARVEAETTATISWGLFVLRLNPGARLVFEQTEVNADLWLPKRLLLTGSGRIGLLKRVAQDIEIDWSEYKRFSVDSKVVTEGGAKE